MKRILQVVPYMQSGGTETFIMNVYKNINREKIQFDFLVHTKKEGYYDNEIKKLGGKIYCLPIKDNKNFFKYIKELDQFFKNHKEYKIIHANMPSIGFLYLMIAKKNGIKIRIAHSHTSSFNLNVKGILKHFTSKLMASQSNINLACSKKAGKYMFGNKKFEITYNGIDLNKFSFNKKVRNAKRKELNLENKIVIGHVGRFAKEKNHRFMIELLEKLLKFDDKYHLVFVGDGELRNKIELLINKKGLQNNITIIKPTPDVNKLLQAFDIFLMPSTFEGLSIASIEAQQSLLPCLVSTAIPDEAIQTDYIKRLNLNSDIWIKEILKIDLNKREKNNNKSLVENYDIKKVSKILEEKYLSYLD